MPPHQSRCHPTVYLAARQGQRLHLTKPHTQKFQHHCNEAVASKQCCDRHSNPQGPRATSLPMPEIRRPSAPPSQCEELGHMRHRLLRLGNMDNVLNLSNPNLSDVEIMLQCPNSRRLNLWLPQFFFGRLVAVAYKQTC